MFSNMEELKPSTSSCFLKRRNAVSTPQREDLQGRGLGEKLNEPLPPPYDRVKRECFVPFMRSTGLGTDIQLVVADGRLRGKVSPAIDALLDDLVAHAPHCSSTTAIRASSARITVMSAGTTSWSGTRCSRRR